MYFKVIMIVVVSIHVSNIWSCALRHGLRDTCGIFSRALGNILASGLTV